MKTFLPGVRERVGDFIFFEKRVFLIISNCCAGNAVPLTPLVVHMTTDFPAWKSDPT